MKQVLLQFLLQKNVDLKKVDIEKLYQAGIKNIVDNIEFYHDKPYTCNSVFKELFERGVHDSLKSANSIGI